MPASSVVTEAAGMADLPRMYSLRTVARLFASLWLPEVFPSGEAQPFMVMAMPRFVVAPMRLRAASRLSKEILLSRYRGSMEAWPLLYFMRMGEGLSGTQSSE